jgi:16S rRNA (adenine1518-N6/adenine1519-N6)-dimethyltransferase
LGEELGWKAPEPLKRLFKLAASPQTGLEHVWVYRCEAQGPFRLDPEEIERGGWFAPQEVTRWLAERPEEFAGALRVIWDRLRHSSPGVG